MSTGGMILAVDSSTTVGTALTEGYRSRKPRDGLSPSLRPSGVWVTLYSSGGLDKPDRRFQRAIDSVCGSALNLLCTQEVVLSKLRKQPGTVKQLLTGRRQRWSEVFLE